jgi:hypothetical protein
MQKYATSAVKCSINKLSPLKRDSLEGNCGFSIHKLYLSNDYLRITYVIPYEI